MKRHFYDLFRHRRRTVALAPAFVSAAFLLAHAWPAAAATGPVTTPRYALSVLPTLGAAFDISSAAGVNDKGWIVGDANVPGSTGVVNATEHATLWRHGVITDLGALGGPNSSIGFVAHPNDTGLISGNAQIGTVDPFGEGWGLNFGCDVPGDPCAGSQYEVRGFAWNDGVTRPLPTLGGNNALAFGGANDLGQIVGTAEDATPDPACAPPQVFDFKPVLWGPQYGEIQALPTYPGDSIGATTAANDRGQVVGGSGACGPPSFPAITHALIWQGGSPINLGNLGGQFDNIPTAINSLGQVVGWSDTCATPSSTGCLNDGPTHAFLWQNGVMSDLGTLPGDASSTAMAIDNTGQVTGSSCDASGITCHAFLWQDGTMTDINAIADVDTPAEPFELVNANGINDQGEIVGFGVYPSTGQGRAYVALPCRGPAATTHGCTNAARAARASRSDQAAPRTHPEPLISGSRTLSLSGSRLMTLP